MPPHREQPDPRRRRRHLRTRYPATSSARSPWRRSPASSPTSRSTLLGVPFALPLAITLRLLRPGSAGRSDDRRRSWSRSSSRSPQLPGRPDRLGRRAARSTSRSRTTCSRPTSTGRRCEVHPLGILIGILIGASLLGILGALDRDPRLGGDPGGHPRLLGLQRPQPRPPRQAGRRRDRSRRGRRARRRRRPELNGALARGRGAGRPAGRAPARRDLRRAHVGPAVGGRHRAAIGRSAAICAATGAASCRRGLLARRRRRRAARAPRRSRPATLVGASFGGLVCLDVAAGAAGARRAARPRRRRRWPATSGRRRCASSSSGRRSCSRRDDVDAAVELNLRTWVDGPRARPRGLRRPARRVGEMQRRAFELQLPVWELHRGRAPGRAT